jgi:microcystin degradation protein MlrC
VKRVGVVYLVQESNTFSPLATALDDFDITLGGEAVERWRGTRTEIGGFLDALKLPEIEIVPLFAGWAITKGRILAGEFERMKCIAKTTARAAGPLDGMLVALHGAMCAEGADDAEGALLGCLREVVGARLPLILTLDLHANLTRRICALADAVIGYRTYPHIDMYETGTAAARMLLGILKGEPKLRTVMHKLPMVVPAENMQTTAGAMAEVWRRGVETQPAEVRSFSVFGVQPWLDIDEMGCAVVAVTSGTPVRARAFCEGVARRFEELRHQFDVTLVKPAEAIREALATVGAPVVLSESSDSPTAGSPGDSAQMLAALLEHAPGTKAAVWLRDEEAVEQARLAGVGARIKVALGGLHDKLNRRRVQVEAKVLRLSNGHFTMRGSQYTGLETSMGRAAVLQVGAVTVVVSSLSANNIDPELYRSQGIEPREYKIVIVKSAAGFRAEYAPFAAKMLVVDTPGVSSANLRTLPYRRVPPEYLP